MFARLLESMYLCTRKTKDALLEDPLAQLVEHNTFNVGVLGSSPSQVTFFNVSSLRGEIGRLAILRGWCSLGRAGSNPVVGTEVLEP